MKGLSEGEGDNYQYDGTHWALAVRTVDTNPGRSIVSRSVYTRYSTARALIRRDTFWSDFREHILALYAILLYDILGTGALTSALILGLKCLRVN